MKETMKNKGFSIIELIVVIAVIMILISFLLPGLNRSRQLAERTRCMNNHAQLANAWITYSIVNKQVMPVSHTNNRGWTRRGNSENAIKDGSLFEYVNDLDVYKCPSDDSKHRHTYSANGFLNGEESWPFNPHVQPFKYISNVVHPDKQLVFAEENDPRGWNVGSWVIYPKGHSRQNRWIDYVGVFHQNGDNVSFLDGHVEFFEYQDSRTIKFGEGGWHFFSNHPDNPDLKKYQSMYNTN